MPARRVLVQQEFGLYLLLASLGMFFVAALLALLVRRSGAAPVPGQFPPILWVSTVTLLAGGGALQQALRQVKLEHQQPFRRWLLIAVICGSLFCVLQSIGLTQLLLVHVRLLEQIPALPVSVQAASNEPQPFRAFGALFALVLLHVLHFLGGLIVLLRVVRQGFDGRFDHEYYAGVKLCAVYWRFLDVIWLLMMATFYVTL